MIVGENILGKRKQNVNEVEFRRLCNFMVYGKLMYEL
jgi:hypothetical protein